MKIEAGKRVQLRVVLKTDQGETIEDNEIHYVQGAGTILPGLEEELEGLEKGAQKSGTLPPDRAFGSPEHRVEKAIPRGEFPEDAELKAGERFGAKGPNDQDIILRILEADGESVRAELVHPLADTPISYEAEVLAVADSTPPPVPSDALTEESE